MQHKPDEPHCHNVSEEQKDKIELCTVLVPTGYAGNLLVYFLRDENEHQNLSFFLCVSWCVCVFFFKLLLICLELQTFASWFHSDCETQALSKVIRGLIA